jgi:hypothetical protein
MARPSKLTHPTFGACELVSSIVLVRWKAPTTRDAAASALSAASLSLSDDTAKGGKGEARNPAEMPVNHSSLASFATASKVSDAELKKLSASPNVEWVGPVYRASAAEKRRGSPRSAV